MNTATNKLPKPPSLTRKWVRYVISFGVGVVVGLAPYLGTLEVPLFRPLLSLYPLSLRDTMIPLSSAAMGILAVTIQWLAGEKVAPRWLRTWFKRALALVIAGFVLLIVFHSLLVQRVDIEGGKDSVSFVLSFSRTRMPACSCDPNDSDSRCIQKITLDPAEIATCWGDRPITIASLALILSYLVATSGFGLLTGLLVLQGRK